MNALFEVIILLFKFIIAYANLIFNNLINKLMQHFDVNKMTSLFNSFFSSHILTNERHIYIAFLFTYAYFLPFLSSFRHSTAKTDIWNCKTKAWACSF